MNTVLKAILILMLIITPVWGGINSSNGRVNCGSMGNFGTGLDTIYLCMSFWIKTTDASPITMFRDFVGGTNQGISITLNLDASDGATNTEGELYFFRRDLNNQAKSGGVNFNLGFTDGEWHFFVICLDNNDNGPTVYYDSVSQTTISHLGGNADNMGNFSSDARIFSSLIGHTTDIILWSQSSVPSQSFVDELYDNRIKRNVLQIFNKYNITLNGGYWPLDDVPNGVSINSKTFRDLSGNGNDATGVDAQDDSLGAAEEFLSYP